jgi:YHS domain-containing protein
MPSPFRFAILSGLTVASMFALQALADSETPPPQKDSSAAAPGDANAQKAALAGFNPLIGKWRGIGQPRRGSSQGAWQEEAAWIWDFADQGVAVRLDVAQGKLLKTARITYSTIDKEFTAHVTTPKDEQLVYHGKPDEDGKIVLVSDPDESGDVHRLTVTRLNEKRSLVLFEKHGANQTNFSRVAEVGYTREGARLAKSGGSGPECIVTGGTGEIMVSYKGKTYYVCCEGCKQAFEDDPEAVLAEAASRKEREKTE